MHVNFVRVKKWCESGFSWHGSKGSKQSCHHVHASVTMRWMHLDVNTSLHHINMGSTSGKGHFGLFWNYFSCHKPCGDWNIFWSLQEFGRQIFDHHIVLDITDFDHHRFSIITTFWLLAFDCRFLITTIFYYQFSIATFSIVSYSVTAFFIA